MKFLLVILLIGVIAITQAKLPMDSCEKTVPKSSDPKALKGNYYLILRPNFRDTGKCYEWNFKQTPKTLNLAQTVQVLGSATNQTFEMNLNKNGTYDILSSGKESSQSTIYAVGSYLYVYNCKKSMAVTILAGVYSNKKVSPDVAELNKIYTELKKNKVQKKDVATVDVKKCKYIN